MESTTSPLETFNDHLSVIEQAATPEQFAGIQETLKTQLGATSYKAQANIASLLFYMQVKCLIDGGETFSGKSGGIALPGGGVSYGYVTTSDINALYSDTKTFSFAGNVIAFNIIFYNKDHHAIGTFNGGGLSTAVGTGGGTGKWE